jgi:methionyl aminopeptidase
MIGPGVTTREIDAQICATFAEFGGTPLFLNYPPDSPHPFPAATCVSVNEQVVHGIPGHRKLRHGDIVAVDTGCAVGGWCGDAAVTHAIGQVSPQTETLLGVTRQALDEAIAALGQCQWWSEVTRRIEQVVQPHGLGIIESMVGHGIGRSLHEAPDVPNYFDPQWQGDFAIRPGLVLAIEPMINLGGKEIRTCGDQWTIVTSDGSYSAHFEHTVAVTEQGPLRLTAEPSDLEYQSRTWPEWLPPRDQWLRW